MEESIISSYARMKLKSFSFQQQWQHSQADRLVRQVMRMVPQKHDISTSVEQFNLFSFFKTAIFAVP